MGMPCSERAVASSRTHLTYQLGTSHHAEGGHLPSSVPAIRVRAAHPKLGFSERRSLKFERRRRRSYLVRHAEEKNPMDPSDNRADREYWAHVPATYRPRSLDAPRLEIADPTVVR